MTQLKAKKTIDENYFTSLSIREKKLLRISDVMKLTGLSRSTINRQINNGNFSVRKPKDSNIVYLFKSEVLRWQKAEKSQSIGLAQYMIEDGQDVRAIWNYLIETFDLIKGHEFFGDKTHENLVEFLYFVSSVAKLAAEQNKQHELDEIES